MNHRINCEHWDDARGWCPASFRGQRDEVLWAAEQHAAAAHHRPVGPRLRGELRSRMRR
jgi:hypothetical protein